MYITALAKYILLPFDTSKNWDFECLLLENKLDGTCYSNILDIFIYSLAIILITFQKWKYCHIVIFYPHSLGNESTGKNERIWSTSKIRYFFFKISRQLFHFYELLTYILISHLIINIVRTADSFLGHTL